MDYRVSLDVYSGPLDLLIHLIRRTEVDVHTVPVSTIIDQFIATVLEIQADLDLELAGEFLVLASTLLELKSELLLPGADGSAQEDAVRLGLVRQLIEFKRYRDMANALEQMRAAESRCFRRPDGLVAVDEPPDVWLDDVNVGDVFRGWVGVLDETVLQTDRTIVYDDRPVEEVLDELRETLPIDEWRRLRDVVPEPVDQGRLIGTFWAVLELTKRQEAEIDMRDDQMWLRRLEAPEQPPEAQAEAARDARAAGAAGDDDAPGDAELDSDNASSETGG